MFTQHFMMLIMSTTKLFRKLCVYYNYFCCNQLTVLSQGLTGHSGYTKNTIYWNCFIKNKKIEVDSISKIMRWHNLLLSVDFSSENELCNVYVIIGHKKNQNVFSPQFNWVEENPNLELLVRHFWSRRLRHAKWISVLRRLSIFDRDKQTN